MLGESTWQWYVGTAIVLLLGGVAFLQVRKRNRWDAANRAEDKAEAADRDSRDEGIRLSTSPIKLVGKLRPAPAGVVDEMAPVDFHPEGSNVWVHQVELRWHYKDEAVDPEWQACERREGGLPVHKQAGQPDLEFNWPGDPPPRQDAIAYELRAECSIAEHGTREWYVVEVRGVDWQRA
jgi:hypothetical protein